jgi:8-oxo-dGTP diphosphatase
MSNEHEYPQGRIQLLLYQVDGVRGEIRLRDHDLCAWVSPEELARYTFSPADVPFVERLVKDWRGSVISS